MLRSKETTGRVVVWRQFATPNSFTLEASFCGADFGPGAGAHYSIANLKEMGAAFVPALLDFIEPSQIRVNAIMADLEAQFPNLEDEADDADGGEGGAKEGGADSFADASEKLRRAARAKTRAAAASKVVKAGKDKDGGSSSDSKKTTGKAGKAAKEDEKKAKK